MTDDQASSNVAYRILDINKLFRSKNRFYLDPFRSYAKEGARRSRELRDGLQSLELLRMHDTFQRKVHQCGTILVSLPTKYRKIALNSRCSWIGGSQTTRELAQLWELCWSDTHTSWYPVVSFIESSISLSSGSRR
jgi:hypothetical protein